MENTELTSSGKKEIYRFNVVNSLIVFLLTVVVIYQIHYWTNGRVLSSPLLTFTIFSAVAIILSIKIWPWMKFNTDYVRDPRDWRWIIISAFASCLTLSVHFRMTDSPGDFRMHKLWVLNLLNGSKESSLFYMEDPGLYPFIAHTVVAVFTNITGLYVQYSLIIVLVLISFLIPLISYNLARQSGFSPLLSLLFSGLISLYGGVEDVSHYSHTGVNWYIPAMSIAQPFLGRNSGFLIFLLFLLSCSRISKLSKPTFNNLITIGILLGLMGVTHPNGFFSGILFVFVLHGVIYKTNLLQNKIFSSLMIIFITGGILASLYYVPFMLKLLNSGGSIVNHLHKDKFPISHFLSLYGPLPFIGLCAFWNKKTEMTPWIWLSFLMIVTIVSMRLIVGLVISIDTWVTFKINYYGPFMFVFLVFLAIAGTDSLIGYKKLKHIIVLIMVLIINGYIVAFINLNNEVRTEQHFDLIPGISKNDIVRAFSGNIFQVASSPASEVAKGEILRVFVENLFPEKDIEKLRFNIADKTNTLIVPVDPPELAFIIAHETGLSVSYVHDNYFSSLVTFNKKSIPQEQRQKKVNEFYSDLSKGILRQDILSFFKTDMFLSLADDLAEQHSLLEMVTSVHIENKEYCLYRMR